MSLHQVINTLKASQENKSLKKGTSLLKYIEPKLHLTFHW